MAPLGHRECFSSEIVEFVDRGEGVWDDDISLILNYLAGYVYLVDLSKPLPVTSGRKATSHDLEM
jgi:hypothetical protein